MSSSHSGKLRKAGFAFLIFFSSLIWLAVIGDIVYYLLFNGTGTL